MSKPEKKGLVPVLRFPEFQGRTHWVEKTLGDITFKVDKKNKAGYRYPIYSINNQVGFIPQAEQFDGVDSHKRGYDISLYKVIEKNTFAYNPARINVGSIGYSDSLHNIIISSLYVCFKATEEADVNFLRHFFDSFAFTESVKNNAEGGIRSYLFYENFAKIVIALPKLEEQQKIADCLTSIDELIIAQTQKLDALKTHKKGLMQQLFPTEGETVPQLRFPEFRDTGEWIPMPIGDKVDLLSGYPFTSAEISEDSSGIPLMRGINITEGFIRHSQDIDRFYLGEMKNLEKYRVKTSDLVIGMDGSKVGKNSALITDCDAGALLIQRVARLRTDCAATILFIFQHINSSRFHSYVDRINTSGGIPHISAKQINDFEICFPPNKEEQRKIADCLTAIDELITAQNKKIESLKVHKKGLMQQLFPIIDEVNT